MTSISDRSSIKSATISKSGSRSRVVLGRLLLYEKTLAFEFDKAVPGRSIDDDLLIRMVDLRAGESVREAKAAGEPMTEDEGVVEFEVMEAVGRGRVKIMTCSDEVFSTCLVCDPIDALRTMGELERTEDGEPDAPLLG